MSNNQRGLPRERVAGKNYRLRQFQAKSFPGVLHSGIFHNYKFSTQALREEHNFKAPFPRDSVHVRAHRAISEWESVQYLLLSRCNAAGIILFPPLLLNQPPPHAFPLLFPPSPIKTHNHIWERLRTYPFHMALAIQAKLSLWPFKETKKQSTYLERETLQFSEWN